MCDKDLRADPTKHFNPFMNHGGGGELPPPPLASGSERCRTEGCEGSEQTLELM